mgnify:CR=1 FL=1
MSVISNLLQNGTNVLAVEIHNASASSSDLTCRPFLTFGLASQQQQFNGYVHPFFNTPQAGTLESNFSIATAGETLYLSNSTGIIFGRNRLSDCLSIPSCANKNITVSYVLDGTERSSLNLCKSIILFFTNVQKFSTFAKLFLSFYRFFYFNVSFLFLIVIS